MKPILLARVSCKEQEKVFDRFLLRSGVYKNMTRERTLSLINSLKSLSHLPKALAENLKRFFRAFETSGL
ncbi:hypothetical protein PRO82_002183 [Candidatus Protochlamydia amoebophila]|nr:hypothetical protein [Candidatus Protochlamydia amoebophila]